MTLTFTGTRKKSTIVNIPIAVVTGSPRMVEVRMVRASCLAEGVTGREAQAAAAIAIGITITTMGPATATVATEAIAEATVEDVMTATKLMEPTSMDDRVLELDFVKLL